MHTCAYTHTDGEGRRKSERRRRKDIRRRIERYEREMAEKEGCVENEVEALKNKSAEP